MKTSVRLFLYAAAAGALALAGGVIPAEAQVISLDSPEAEEIVSPATSPNFEWVATGTFVLYQIRLSTVEVADDEAFPVGPETVTYPRLGGIDRTSQRVDTGTWRRVVGKGAEMNGVLYWRVRGVTDGDEVVLSNVRKLLVSNAANAGEVDLLMRQENVRGEDEFSVAVLANSGIRVLGGVSLRITYNPNVLELLSSQIVNGAMSAPYVEDAAGGSLFMSFMNMEADPGDVTGLVPVIRLPFRVRSGTGGGTAGIAGSVLTIGTRGTVIDPEPEQPWAETPRPALGGGALSITGG